MDALVELEHWKSTRVSRENTTSTLYAREQGTQYAPESNGIFGDVIDGPVAAASVGIPPMSLVQKHVLGLHDFVVVGRQGELKRRGREERRETGRQQLRKVRRREQ
jgi:hypothetical protein